MTLARYTKWAIWKIRNRIYWVKVNKNLKGKINLYEIPVKL